MKYFLIVVIFFILAVPLTSLKADQSGIQTLNDRYGYNTFSSQVILKTTREWSVNTLKPFLASAHPNKEIIAHNIEKIVLPIGAIIDSYCQSNAEVADALHSYLNGWWYFFTRFPVSHAFKTHQEYQSVVQQVKDVAKKSPAREEIIASIAYMAYQIELEKRDASLNIIQKTDCNETKIADLERSYKEKLSAATCVFDFFINDTSIVALSENIEFQNSMKILCGLDIKRINFEKMIRNLSRNPDQIYQLPDSAIVSILQQLLGFSEKDVSILCKHIS